MSMLSTGGSSINERVFTPVKQPNGNSIAEIKCQVKKEDVKVNWLRDEELITEDTKSNKYKVLENGRERILVVSDVHADDEGEYVCQSGKYRVTLYLNINEPRTGGLDVYRASSSVTCDDESRDLFFIDDRSVRSRSRSSSRTTLTPQPTPMSHHTTHTTTTTTTTTRRALTYVKDMYVHEGMKKVELKCQVRSPDTPVEWIRNNKTIDKSNSKYDILARGNERILVIKNPTRADNGDYICQTGKNKVVLNLNVGRETTPSTAGGPYSSDDESLFVRTTSKKKRTSSSTTNITTTKYQFEEPELTYYVNQHAVLKCEVKNENEPIVWLKDNNHLFGSNMQLNDDKYAQAQDGAERTLIIKNLSYQDSGNYSCHSKTKPTSRVEFKMKVKG